MIAFPWLLADLDAWIRIIIILIFVVGPILNQLGGGNKRKPAQRKPPPPRPAGGAGAGNALENEIEVFLRQAQQRKEAGQPPNLRQQPAGAPPRPVQPRPRQPVPLRPQTPTQPRPAARQPRQPQLGQGVARHVQEHIMSRPVSEQSSRLGERVRLADDLVEHHLHAAFDHQLGQLDRDIAMEVSTAARSSIRQQQDEQAQQAQSQIADIRRILSDPTAIREAIVLTEILQPPLGLRE